MTQDNLWKIGFDSIKELETERGILASGRQEVFGCIFGRDSLITSISLLKVFEKTRDEYFLHLVRKVLENLSNLQGREVNIESGEEPGKCIHEFRPDSHERLTVLGNPPWYVYPDHAMRNYDSVDSTPLFLMAFARYLRSSGDEDFIERFKPNILKALDWMKYFGDRNGDGFLDYSFHPDRKYGGLRSQSWMDSAESVFFENETVLPSYPIAPVEVQAYAYVAFKEWGKYFEDSDLLERANNLKEKFNKTFVLDSRRTSDKITLAFALDGENKLLKTPRSSMGHVLWAVVKEREEDGTEAVSSILNKEYIPSLASRLISRDLFVPKAGIRTLSSRSKYFDPTSYHNGSIWPHDTAILAEGFDNFGYHDAAKEVREALVSAFTHFATPIELFAFTRGCYKEYRNSDGQGACRTQAWSAASILATLV